MTEPILAARGVSKSYGSLAAVRDLTFEAFPGEIVGLLGPNGAGKTTAIRVLTTILSPTSGEFRVAGVPANQPQEIRRRIGVLPEASGYPNGFTGDRYLRYHARLFGQTRTKPRRSPLHSSMKSASKDKAQARIATYSRGMRQRLGIARALVNQPQVIFLDEPTLGLDPAGQRQVLRLIIDIARNRGATVVLSTHFLDEVEEVCSRVLILHHGTVVAQGTVDEIKRSASGGRSARVEIPPEQQDAAIAALTRARDVVAGVEEDERRGRLQVTLARSATDGAAANAVIRTLVEASIPILSFEVEGARLSDAFLRITGEN